MKLWIALLLAIPYVCLSTLVAMPAASQPAIRLASIQDLQQIGLSADFPLDGHYVLTRNIDATATASWLGGAGFAPIGHGIGPFTGVFDGKGYEIRGLVVNRPLLDKVGLFSAVGIGGHVRNLGLVNAAVTGKNQAAPLAGTNAGSISFCYASGSASSLDLWSGGLVAVNASGGEILSCYADVTVSGKYYLGGLVGDNEGTVRTSFATGSVTGTGTAGGLAGYQDGIIEDCYARGAVTAGDSLGSLTGENAFASVTTRCYGTGLVSGNNDVGGLVGLRFLGSATSASYWDMETTGQSASADGEGRSTDQMTYPYAPNVFAGWNFNWVWAMDTDRKANDGYPYLRDTLPPALRTRGCAGCARGGAKQELRHYLGDYLLAGASVLILLMLTMRRTRL